MDKTENISDKEITEEDLLDFELDDLSPEDLGEGVGSKESDEDILELVDLVEEGEQDRLKDSFEGEIADLMKEEDEEISGEGERPEDADTELDLSDISLTDLAAEAEAKPDAMLGEEEIAEAPVEEGMEELPTAAIEMDFNLEEGVPEEKVEEEHITETELEKMLETEPAEEPILDLGSPIEVEEPGLEAESELPVEEAVEPAAAPPEPAEPVAAPVEQAGEGLVGISEEELEAVVTKVVEDVVERATRETMTDVVERVARDTIVDVAERVAREAMTDVAERVAREAMTDVAERVAREAMTDVAERVAREAMTDVAERVAREAMTDVAEKVAKEAMGSAAERVITEAIDALKESLEPASE
jgi:carbon monoxide dehydrogenase subunit G